MIAGIDTTLVATGAVVTSTAWSFDRYDRYDRYDYHRGHWTFEPPEEPRPRPVSDFVPRCRPSARPRHRPVSPRQNRARSRPGGKWAAGRAA